MPARIPAASVQVIIINLQSSVPFKIHNDKGAVVIIQNGRFDHDCFGSRHPEKELLRIAGPALPTALPSFYPEPKKFRRGPLVSGHTYVKTLVLLSHDYNIPTG